MGRDIDDRKSNGLVISDVKPFDTKNRCLRWRCEERGNSLWGQDPSKIRDPNLMPQPLCLHNLPEAKKSAKFL